MPLLTTPFTLSPCLPARPALCSGLVPGDLDPARSPHYLTTLRRAYLKLRHLVDAGAVFVGHGLKKDFRMINIVVPPAQASYKLKLYTLGAAMHPVNLASLISTPCQNLKAGLFTKTDISRMQTSHPCPPPPTHPRLQIVDTVDLFHAKRSRKLSLRFLASYLLRSSIQEHTHDSIEDAATALK